MILGFDASHFQGAINFPAAKAGGQAFVVLKASEGVGYVDPMFAANRKAAHAAGLIVGIYHFGRDNSPAAEAAYFAGVVGALQPGEFLVLDQEVTHASGNVPWCTAWLDATRAHYGVAPLIYMNKGNSTGVTSGNWTAVAQTYGLWLASYDNAPAVQTAVPYWGVPAMKQYSDKGTVAGVAGTCDVDVFYGDATALAAYCAGGSDMPLNDVDKAWLSNLIRPMSDAVTPGIEGVKFDGVTYAEAKAAHAAAQAAADGIAKVAAPTVDAQALAAALVADTGAIGTLADALASAIAKRLGNG